MSDRRRNLFILLITLGLLAGSIVVITSKKTKLGLDLQGGVQLVFQAQPTRGTKLDSSALGITQTVLRKRVDQYGVSEPEIQIAGKDQIDVSLPAVRDPARAVAQIGTTAQMFFYDLEGNLLDSNCTTHPDIVLGGAGQATQISGLYNAVKQASKCTKIKPTAQTPTDNPSFYAFDKTSKNAWNSGQPESTRAQIIKDVPPARLKNAEIIEVPVGVVVVRNAPDTSGANAGADIWFVLQDRPFLKGSQVTNPMQTFDQQRGNVPVVSMNFNGAGTKAFTNETRILAERGRDNAFGNNAAVTSMHFAVRLDQNLITTPTINWRDNPTGIDGGNGAIITGSFDIQSAQSLANLLKAGALPVKLKIISQSQVSATLGSQALKQGLIAGLAGFGIVALFLLAFYRILGLIATLALGIYAAYFYALIKLIPVVLTLPGIAGLILTIGVVADANIVIFERVKEEIRGGRSIPAGIAVGYKKGFSTIVDANVVTLLTAFILYILATAGVKAFAFTLGVGTLVSLFTAVLATQAILLSMRKTRILHSKAALGAGMNHRRWNFNFIGASKWFFSMSGLILLVGGLSIAGNGLKFGIDLQSGTRVTSALAQKASVDQVRNALRPIGYGDAKIQVIQNHALGNDVVQISTKTLAQDKLNLVENTLKNKFGQGTKFADITSVGPTFAGQVANTALIAIIASLIIISLYIALRFQWKYAVPVVISLLHDILITAGVYSLVGREVTTSTVAALLTILGYSLYDTIIVFDRIRENVPRMPTAAFSQIVNRSMSEVLTRSLATSFCTVLPVVALFFFGGETLKDFAFALIVGIASGTYSSIFIAAPVLTHWKERETVYRSRENRIKAELGHVPAFAVEIGGAPIDVTPAPKRRRTGSITAPSDPTQVSQEEFEEMVGDLGMHTHDQPGEGRRPSGGRRARIAGGQQAPRQADDLDETGKPRPPKPKKPKNRRHGRPR